MAINPTDEQIDESRKQSRKQSLRLCGGIGGEERKGWNHHRCPRADVDDGPSSSSKHPRQYRAQDLRHAHEIHLQDASQHRLIHLVEVKRIDINHPGVVHQDPDLNAPDHAFQPSHLCCEVPCEVDDGRPQIGSRHLGLDCSCDLTEFLGAAADEDKVEASPRQFEGVGLADAVGGPGDDRPSAILEQILIGAEEAGVQPEEKEEGKS